MEWRGPIVMFLRWKGSEEMRKYEKWLKNRVEEEETHHVVPHVLTYEGTNRGEY
jgi:hypothetical protein